MPKVKASLADISTEYTPIEPRSGVRFQMKEIKERNTNENGIERQFFDWKAVVSEPGDDHGKPVFGVISVHKKDGGLNDAGLGELKRFFEAIAPEYANDENAEVDVLVGGEFLADVEISTYKYPEGHPKHGQKDRVSNQLNRNSITSI